MLQKHVSVIIKPIIWLVSIVIFCAACLVVLFWLDARKAANMYKTMDAASADAYMRERLQGELIRRNDPRASMDFKDAFRSCLISNEPLNKKAKLWVYKYYSENTNAPDFHASLMIYPDSHDWEIHSLPRGAILGPCLS